MREKILQNYYKQILNTIQMRSFLRVTGEHEDLIITNLARSVVKYAEQILNFELSHKEILLDGKFTKNITLKTPLIQINYVKSDKKEVNFKVEKNVLIPDIKVGENLEVNYEVGFMEDEIPDDLRMALTQHLISLYDIRIGGGKIPNFSLEVYGKYRMVNL